MKAAQQIVVGRSPRRSRSTGCTLPAAGRAGRGRPHLHLRHRLRTRRSPSRSTGGRPRPHRRAVARDRPTVPRPSSSTARDGVRPASVIGHAGPMDTTTADDETRWAAVVDRDRARRHRLGLRRAHDGRLLPTELPVPPAEPGERGVLRHARRGRGRPASGPVAGAGPTAPRPPTRAPSWWRPPAGSWSRRPPCRPSTSWRPATGVSRFHLQRVFTARTGRVAPGLRRAPEGRPGRRPAWPTGRR